MTMQQGDYGQRRPPKGKRASFPVCKTITLTEGQAAKVAETAELDGVNFSAVIRRLIEENLG